MVAQPDTKGKAKSCTSDPRYWAEYASRASRGAGDRDVGFCREGISSILGVAPKVAPGILTHQRWMTRPQNLIQNKLENSSIGEEGTG